MNNCKDCKGTGVYVGLCENGPCLTCCGGKERKNVEVKSTMMKLANGIKVWVLNPEELDPNDFDWDKAILHRENDKPAIEDSNGTKEWYKNGKLHRENDKPAIEDSSGTKYWYKEGKLHRENDLPAFEHSSGTKCWYKEDKLHRENDLPAIEHSFGSKCWCKEDKLHRDNGKPAIIWNNGSKEYWINGKRIKY